jgi:hypothetical protein
MLGTREITQRLLLFVLRNEPIDLLFLHDVLRACPWQVFNSTYVLLLVTCVISKTGIATFFLSIVSACSSVGLLSHVTVLDAVLVNWLLSLLLVAEVGLVAVFAIGLAVLVGHRTVALLLLRLLGSRHLSVHLVLRELALNLMVAGSGHAGCSLVSIGNLLMLRLSPAIVDLSAPWFCTLVVITRDIHICLRFDNVRNLIISPLSALINRIFTYSINTLLQILHASRVFHSIRLQLAQQLFELLRVFCVNHVY